uniref:Uncharacterized protein n=1 Tax=Zea mays TaxID=4577 RepID=C0HJ23_MAIZE|nr:unknown [Zea mays]
MQGCCKQISANRSPLGLIFVCLEDESGRRFIFIHPVKWGCKLEVWRSRACRLPHGTSSPTRRRTFVVGSVSYHDQMTLFVRLDQGNNRDMTARLPL